MLGILMVDDDEEHVESTRAKLQGAGVENPVVHVETAAEAYEYMRGKGRFQGVPRPRPGVILLDLSLPDAHGSEFLEFMQQHEKLKNTPVIVLTDAETTQSPSVLRGLGALGLIEKPVSLDSLLRAVRNMDEDWLVISGPKDDEGIEVEGEGKD